MEISDVIILSRAYKQQKFVMETVFEISDLLHSESVFDESKSLSSKVNVVILPEASVILIVLPFTS